MKRRGLMFAVSSPSGAGKTSLCRALLDREEAGLELSISVTTRERRDGEIDGKHYHFRSESDFHAMRESGGLIEHAKVFSNWYGTPRAPVERALLEGRDILFDIDWQGVRQLRDGSPDDLVSLFLLPPNGDELLNRLRTRAQDSEDVIGKRMKMASGEVDHYGEYGYIIVNRDLNESVSTARAILTSERHRRERLVGLDDWIADLQKQL
ncbi:MAG: guanylate kinase [Hyphomicrobiales bacterium]|nr:guanylate kinase [Hyphomicrobiales bacterium]